MSGQPHFEAPKLLHAGNASCRSVASAFEEVQGSPRAAQQFHELLPALALS
jgi:hypothetical protein